MLLTTLRTGWEPQNGHGRTSRWTSMPTSAEFSGVFIVIDSVFMGQLWCYANKWLHLASVSLPTPSFRNKFDHLNARCSRYPQPVFECSGFRGSTRALDSSRMALLYLLVANSHRHLHAYPYTSRKTSIPLVHNHSIDSISFHP
jgi:hypothetical protein